MANRPEVDRNIRYSMIYRTKANAEDHCHEYKVLEPRSFWDLITLKRTLIVLILMAITSLVTYAIVHKP